MLSAKQRNCEFQLFKSFSVRLGEEMEVMGPRFTKYETKAKISRRQWRLVAQNLGSAARAKKKLT